MPRRERARAGAPETVRDLRRGQIVAAARRIVAEEGLEALTIGNLEERLHFTRGVITYHFRDKEDIVHAVLESAIAEIDAATLAAVMAQATPAERVAAVIRANVRGYLDHKEAGLILVSFWGRASDKRAQRANAALYAGYRAKTAALLRAGQAAGAFTNADADADALAAVIVGVVIGIVTQLYFASGCFDVEMAIEEATRGMLARLAGRGNGVKPLD